MKKRLFTALMAMATSASLIPTMAFTAMAEEAPAEISYDFFQNRMLC